MSKRNVFLGLVTAVLLLGSSVARADLAKAYKKYKGQILVAEVEWPGDYDLAAMKKLSKVTLTKPKDSETWSLNVLAFLKSKPGVTPIHLVFYDITKKREYRSAKEINIDPSSNIVVTTVEVGEDDNVEAGKKYDVLLARMEGGKEIIYARAKLTFK